MTADPRPFPPDPPRALARLACALVQPVLSRAVRRVAREHPGVFDRLGGHRRTDYVIDARELPFALHLRPDPDALRLRAVPRAEAPRGGAMIRGRFLLLLKLVDSGGDGDAAFFSRDLEVTGDTEAVVRLRHALDDMDGSIAEETAALFGPPGLAVLARLRRRYADSDPQAGAVTP